MIALRGEKMKYLKLLIPIIIILILISAAGTVQVLLPSKQIAPKWPQISDKDFADCKVEILEHSFLGGAVLGELNAEDTEYFVGIMKAMELKETPITNYMEADGESAREYLITLKNGEKIYFGQAFGTAEGYENSAFVYVNDKVYVIENPAVLNGLYVVKERFMFYDRLSGVTQG